MNKEIKVLIVEDESLIAEEIKDLLGDHGMETVGIAVTAQEAIKILDEKKPDVVLLDVNIKGSTNGIELGSVIKTSTNIPIIFLTSNTDKKTVEEARKIMPQAFLSKPFNEKDLPIAIELAFSNYNSENFLVSSEGGVVPPSHIFLKKNARYEKIAIEDVMYVEAEGSYCNIITANGNFLVSYNLSCFQKEVNHTAFLRVHRSFIINLNNIEAFDSTNVFIQSKQIPISQAYHEQFFKRIKKL